MHNRDFYSRGEDKMATLPIPDEYIEIGRICAARYESQWHRAEIISVLDESVKVSCGQRTNAMNWSIWFI